MVVVQKNQTKTLLLPALPQTLTPGLAVAHAASLAILGLVVDAARSFDDATAAMAFYGVYHREPFNQLIHFFGVPLILWSMIVFQAHLPLMSMEVSLPGVPRHYVSWATLGIVFYVAAYLYMELLGGLLYTPVWYMMYATAVKWTANDQRQALKESSASVSSWTGTGQVLKWAAAAHVFAWYVQIHPGHMIIEGARPAIAQSLGGAVFTAPLFAFYEGIWFMGLRREFHQQVLSLVAEYTQELCAAGVQMRACNSL